MPKKVKGPLDREDDFNGGPDNPFYAPADTIQAAERAAYDNALNRVASIAGVATGHGGTHEAMAAEIVAGIQEDARREMRERAAECGWHHSCDLHSAEGVRDVILSLPLTPPKEKAP